MAILAAEFFNPRGGRNHPADDAAAQMLQELHLPFDVIDPGRDFAPYRVLILPDAMTVDADLAAFAAAGGGVILSDQSGLGADGQLVPDLGFQTAGHHDRAPFYGQADLPGLPQGPFVIYGRARALTALPGTEVLAQALPSHFNRTWAQFCSHQHAPDIPGAAPLGPLVTVKGGFAHVATLTRQSTPAGDRHILHLWYGAPTVRGRGAWGEDGTHRVMEMIEDIPPLGPVTAWLRLPKTPARIHDGTRDLPFTRRADGRIQVTLPGLHIHVRAMISAAPGLGPGSVPIRGRAR